MDINITNLKNKISEDNNDINGNNPIKIIKDILNQVEEITNKSSYISKNYVY